MGGGLLTIDGLYLNSANHFRFYLEMPVTAQPHSLSSKLGPAKPLGDDTLGTGDEAESEVPISQQPDPSPVWSLESPQSPRSRTSSAHPYHRGRMYCLHDHYYHHSLTGKDLLVFGEYWPVG